MSIESPPGKNLGGRPRKLTADEASLKQLAGLGQIQATTREGAAFFSVSEPTFIKFLADFPEAREAFESGKGQGLVSLRRKQFQLAEKNAAMAIFLGKNYLNQTDRQSMDHRFDLTGLTDEELEHLERIRSRIADPRGD